MPSAPCPPAAFDFSGNYLFVAEKLRMHRLDESLSALLESRGGRILRLQADGEPPATPDAWNLRTLPPDFFARHAIRAAFTTDNSAPPDVVPPDVPLIALPHAFWQTPQTEKLLGGWAAYLGNADYYLTQDCPAPGAEALVSSLRRRDVVRLLPFGNLKLDLLRQRWLDEPRKDSIMYCCGVTAHGCSIPEKLEIVRRCLRDFPQYRIVVRPFPGAGAAYAPLVAAFGDNERFVLDTGGSTLRHLPRAATLLYDAHTTTGNIFLLATGQPAVCLPAADRDEVPLASAHVASTPEEVSAAVAACLAQRARGELPELRRLRESILYRPGQARHLFWEYLAAVLQNAVPPQAVAVPCEYIGDCRPATRAEELRLLLRRLQAGSVERSYNLLRGYPLYTSLEAFYRTLRRRAEKQLPCLVRLTQQPGGQKLGICRDDAASLPFLCWGPPHAYGLPGLAYLRTHQRQRLDRLTSDCAILLPDRSLPLFRQAFAELILAVYGPSAGLNPA